MSVSAALIAASAALVTAAVAFTGFLITKDLKTTEFRQAWINDQRCDLAVVIAKARALVRLPAIERACADLRAFDEAAARIALRENPTKQEWRQPLAMINDMRVSLNAGTANSTAIERLVASLTSDAQVLLKTEWDRVRVGEETYQRARKVLVVVGVGAAFLILGLFWAIGYGKGFIVLC